MCIRDRYFAVSNTKGLGIERLRERLVKVKTEDGKRRGAREWEEKRREEKRRGAEKRREKYGG